MYVWVHIVSLQKYSQFQYNGLELAQSGCLHFSMEQLAAPYPTAMVNNKHSMGARGELLPLLPRGPEGPCFAEALKSHKESKGTLDT